MGTKWYSAGFPGVRYYKHHTRKHGVKYVELPVAYDGLSVVVNKKNTWVDYLTVAELHKIWKPGSTVKTWKDIR